MIHGKDNKSTLVFSDEINAEYNFDIRSGEVTIYIDNDMTLTNEGLSRSAINIEPNAKLNLYISKDVTLTVNSGFGQDGEIGNENGAKGGPGGYAGIRVPWKDENENGLRDDGEQATLHLYGEGKVIAIGGNAGNGVDSSDTYGGRWRSDGAGARNRTETGGRGGNANSTQTAYLGHNMEFVNTLSKDGSNPNNNTNSSFDGGNGENCGIVNIENDVKIYAYGGSGGSGGSGVDVSAGGAGGYPAARNWRWSELAGGRGKSLGWCWRIFWFKRTGK